MTASVESTRLSTEARLQLDRLYARLEELRPYHVGYPCSHRFDYSELYPLLGYMMNNVGDPFAASNMKENTHDFEREVVREFGDLVNATPEETWGYVTNGGTEGNLYGIFLARELHPDGIVYYCEDTHYSVAKILRLTGMRSIMIRSQKNGEMDYDDLRETLKLHRDVPPVFFLNAGTTMTGAIDRLEVIRGLIDEFCFQRYYIHVDAALMGMMLPFCEGEGVPDWDFRGGIDSMSISGHKFLGMPMPCGVVLAKLSHVERIARLVEYVGVRDTTIMGSRDANAPVFLWYALRTLGREGIGMRVDECLIMAEYAVERFNRAGIPAWKNDPSVTVVFPRPTEQIFNKWTIAPYGEISHIITMPHVTREMIGELAEDLAADRAGRDVAPRKSL